VLQVEARVGSVRSPKEDCKSIFIIFRVPATQSEEAEARKRECNLLCSLSKERALGASEEAEA